MYISLPAAAKYLGYSLSTIHRFVNEGHLKVYRATPMSHPRVKIADLDALMRDNHTVVAPGADLDTIWAAACAKFGLKDRSKRVH